MSLPCRVFVASMFLAPLFAIGQTASPDSPCRISPYTGATSPDGAIASVRMVNRGVPCLLPNYGLPAEKRHPATSGRITRAPENGTATFVAPSASYVPKSGFVGNDEFEYEAYAAGSSNQQLRLRVKVRVAVSAAP